MFWADEIAQKIKLRNLPFEWVDDMKTPSGKIHVGALRGVVIHDLAYKSLLDIGVKAKYTYVFDNHDPMDSLPIYLPKEKFEKYMGTPLYKIPSPVEGYKNYADYYAQDFISVFTKIGCNPELLWATELYESGKMNDEIRFCLDHGKGIKTIYEEMYKKSLDKDWHPFQIYCTQCGKVSTTKVFDWDGENVYFTCDIDRLDWARGCGYKGKASPFSSKGHVAGKLPWKIEWAVKWKVIGITVEGAGKDHMSAGGSHDLATLICERIIKYPVPYSIPYEFFLVGGKKMSSSKGLGSSASDMLEILPPELLRFLMVKTKNNQAINFDPGGNTIPDLFDDYQKAALSYRDKTGDDYGRIFVMSQLDQKKIKLPPLTARFINLAQWVQMPNMQERIKKEGMEEWAKYAKIWVERYAPDSEKFSVQKDLPEIARSLSSGQRSYLKRLSELLNKTWAADELQTALYDLGKEMGIPSKDIFASIYTSLLGKSHGPKAAWLILSLDADFVKKRFHDVHLHDIYHVSGKDKVSNGEKKVERKKTRENISSEVFSIARGVKKDYPTISIGIAVIKNVQVKKSHPDLEKEKEAFLKSLTGLTTEKLGEYPEIVSYRKLYKAMGVDWHSRRPSPEALLRRVALGKDLYAVNTCVDAYNLIVMKNRVSVGAFDLDTIAFPTELRVANEHEEILLLGDSKPTKYKNSELAYFDKKGGYNIDFNFRDAQRTAVSEKTKNLYINVDGVYDITSEKVAEVLRESCDVITKYCGGDVTEFEIVTSS